MNTKKKTIPTPLIRYKRGPPPTKVTYIFPSVHLFSRTGGPLYIESRGWGLKTPCYEGLPPLSFWGACWGEMFLDVIMWAMKKKRSCLGFVRGWQTTQLYEDYMRIIISHYKEIPIIQPVFLWKYVMRVFLTVAEMSFYCFWYACQVWQGQRKSSHLFGDYEPFYCSGLRKKLIFVFGKLELSVFFTQDQWIATFSSCLQ